MNTIGYLFVLLGGLIVTEAARGRGGNIFQDVKDIMEGLITGDQAKVSAVINATGDSTTADKVQAAYLSASTPPQLDGVTNNALLAEVEKLGTGKPYIYGSAGPKGYDCSGLVWRAMYNLGIYTGPRFTTETFGLVARSIGAKRVSTGAPGDIVVWPGSGPNGHMGVVIGGDRYFSARSSRAVPQIGESSIAGHGHGTPVFYRMSSVAEVTSEAQANAKRRGEG